MKSEYHIKPLFENFKKEIQEKGNKYLIPTGIQPLDNLIEGFELGDLITIAGGVCSGRTIFIMSLIRHMTINNMIPTGIFCMDWKKYDFMNFLLSNVGSVSYSELKRNKFNLEGQEWFSKAVKEIEESPLFVGGFGATSISSIEKKIRDLVLRFNLKLIIITGFQSISFESNFNDFRYGYTRNAQILKNLARELNVTIVLTSRLNWDIEKYIMSERIIPTLKDIRDIGDLDDLSDIVIGLYREGNFFENPNNLSNVVSLFLLKSKNGITHQHIDMVINPLTLSFTGELENEYL